MKDCPIRYDELFHGETLDPRGLDIMLKKACNELSFLAGGDRRFAWGWRIS